MDNRNNLSGGRKWQKFCDAVTVMTVLSVSVIFFLISLIFWKNSLPLLWRILPAVILFAAVCFLCMRLFRHLQRSAFILLMVLSISLQAVFAFSLHTQPVSDFKLMFDSALAAAKGNFDWLQNGYFRRWPYQIPFVLYEALILKVVPSVLALKIMNLVFTAGNVWLVYRIFRFFLPEGYSAAFSFLFSLHPSAFMYVSVLTNQHISLFFLLLGVCLYLHALVKESGDRKKRLLYFLLAGLSFSTSNLMRPEASIAILSVIICTLFYSEKQDFSGKERVIYLVALLLSYFLFSVVVSLILSVCGMAPYGIRNNIPQWKFVLGMDFLHGGVYSESNAYILNINSNAERNKETIRIILDSWKKSDGVIPFLRGKIDCFWNADEPLSWVFQGIDMEGKICGMSAAKLYSLLQLYGRIYRLSLYTVIFLTSTAMLFQQGWKKTAFPTKLCSVIVSMIFFVFLLIEVQPRYRYLASPFLIVLLGNTFRGQTKSGNAGKSRRTLKEEVQSL